MSKLVSHLRNSRVSDWQQKVRGLKPLKKNKEPKPHHLRLNYYEALCRCLDACEPGTVITGEKARKQLAKAATGGTASSTLYNLVGEGDRTYPSLRVALSGTPLLDVLPKELIPGALIAEAKVWSHWPYREGWLDGLEHTTPDDPRRAATTMISELAAWAAQVPRLAVAGETAAPVSAVEDLCAILDDRVQPRDVAPLLARVVELASGPLGIEPHLVLDTIYDDLMDLGFESDWYVSSAVTRLCTGFDALLYLMNRLDEDARGEVVDRLGPWLAEFRSLTEREKGA